MLTSSLATLAAPRRVTNIWGKSGAGKTTIALDVAVSEAMQPNGKVLYITDEPASVANCIKPFLEGQGNENDRLTRMMMGLVLIQVSTFKKQGQAIQQLPLAFPPDGHTRESVEFKNFVETGENDINAKLLGSLDAYKPPSMVVVDELSRTYKREMIVADDPGPLSLQLAMQLGFLKMLAVEKGIKVVITSATRTIARTIAGVEETRFMDVPVANETLDHYVDVDVQVQWTRRAGERNLVITDVSEKNKQRYHLIDMNSLHGRSAGVMIQ